MADSMNRVVKAHYASKPGAMGLVVGKGLWTDEETGYDEMPVVLLPITEDGVGPVFPWMVSWTKYRGLCTEEEIPDHERLPVEFLDKSSEEIDQIIAAALTEILNGGKDGT